MGAAFGRGMDFRDLAQDEARWITVKPNGQRAKGRPVLIDNTDGEVLGGMGGKHNGENISDVHDSDDRDYSVTKAKQETESPKQGAPKADEPETGSLNAMAPKIEKRYAELLARPPSPPMVSSLYRYSKRWGDGIDLDRFEHDVRSAGDNSAINICASRMMGGDFHVDSDSEGTRDAALTLGRAFRKFGNVLMGTLYSIRTTEIDNSVTQGYFFYEPAAGIRIADITE